MACGVCSEGIGPRRLEFPRLADGGRALVCGGMNAQHGHEEEEGYGEDVGDVSVALCDALLAARGNSKSRYLFTSDRLRYERRTHTHIHTHTHTHTHIHTRVASTGPSNGVRALAGLCECGRAERSSTLGAGVCRKPTRERSRPVAARSNGVDGTQLTGPCRTSAPRLGRERERRSI